MVYRLGTKYVIYPKKFLWNPYPWDYTRKGKYNMKCLPISHFIQTCNFCEEPYLKIAG